MQWILPALFAVALLLSVYVIGAENRHLRRENRRMRRLLHQRVDQLAPDELTDLIELYRQRPYHD